MAAFGRCRPKTLNNGYFGQKWPNFGHFGGQKIFPPEIFWWSSKSYGDTTPCKSQKKYRTVKVVGPQRTHAWTDTRTRMNL